MNNLEEKLEYLNTFCTKEELDWDRSKLDGRLIATPSNVEIIRRFDSDEYEDLLHCEVDRDQGSNQISALVAGDNFRLTINLHRNSGAFFYGKDLGDLLSASNGKYCREIPDYYLLQQEGWKSWGGSDIEKSPSAYAYEGVVKFLVLLGEKVVTHKEKDSFLFIGVSEKLILPVIFQPESILRNPKNILNALAIFNSALKSNVHLNEKSHQLKAIIIGRLSNLERGQRCNNLICNLKDIQERFSHNYELFVTGFSFDNDKESLIAENRIYTRSLNDAINSIHSRIIGIPAGTIIPAIVMRSSQVNSKWLEFVILIAAIFICTMIAFSLRSQLGLLKKIRAEYTQRWKRMQSEIPNLTSEFEVEYLDLESCYSLNSKLIKIVSMFLVVFGLVPLATYFDAELLTLLAYVRDLLR